MAYRIAVVGDRHAGKSSYLTRMSTAEFPLQSPDPLQVNIRFNTTHGPMVFACHENSLTNAVGAIIMIDLTQPLNEERILNLRASLGPIPVVLCGNKCDIRGTTTKAKLNRLARFIHRHNIRYYSISAKSNYNFEKPFLELAHQFHPGTTFTD